MLLTVSEVDDTLILMLLSHSRKVVLPVQVITQKMPTTGRLIDRHTATVEEVRQGHRGHDN